MTLFDNKICCHWMFFFANGLMVISFIARQSLWGIVSSYLANVNSIFIWCWGLTSNNFYWEDFFEKGIYWGSGGSRIFPRGVRQLPKLLLFFKFLPKTAWKWKNLDPRGARVPGAPLRSANVRSQLCLQQIQGSKSKFLFPIVCWLFTHFTTPLYI